MGVKFNSWERKSILLQNWFPEAFFLNGFLYLFIYLFIIIFLRHQSLELSILSMFPVVAMVVGKGNQTLPGKKYIALFLVKIAW